MHCLLDEDADAVRLASRRRIRSLAISISLQAAFIATVVALPLLATGKLSLQTQPPTLIYKGTPGDYKPRVESNDQRGGHSKGPYVHVDPYTQPIRTPDRVEMADVDAPEVSRGSGDVCPDCRPDGLIPPIGNSSTDRGPQPPMPERPITTVTRPVRISQTVQEARLINRIDPTYPSLCKQARFEGQVVLHAIVGRDGVMRELSYVSGPACFVQHTLNFVAQWRYRPTILNGEAVEVETTITVIYKLSR